MQVFASIFIEGKIVKYLFVLVVFAASLAEASPQAPPYDLPPDADVGQIHAAVAPETFALSENELAIKVGLRNHAWLDLINRVRPEGQKLSFTSKETAVGYPIDHPMEYSPSLIDMRLASAEKALPPEMKSILFDGAELTEALPVEQDVFLTNGRAIDRVYQSALRWQMMQPYLSYLEDRRARDVRGYYNFGKMAEAERRSKLASPSSWSSEENAVLADWLTQMCMNAGKSSQDCQQNVSTEIAAGHDMNALYDSTLSSAKAVWNSFFAIDSAYARTDIKYGGEDVFNTFFQMPESDAAKSFLQDNIEDEWRWGGWHLKLNFTPNAETHVVFVAGATPHVDRLGGSEITMNADQPLTEYDAQWVIRHEFGHTLGFPDCYLEFYDGDRQVMVSYQLDTTDLMCSRKGHLLEREVSELKRAYGHARK